MKPGPLLTAGSYGLRALGYRSVVVPTSVGRVHLWTATGGGSLPPLVLFHGFGSSAMHWMPMLQLLRRHVAGIVAIDLPGHGFSDPLPGGRAGTETLRIGVVEALDAVDHPPSVVIGNSLGGAAGVRYVNARADRVRGAMLFSPAGAPMNDAELTAIRAVFRVDGHQDAVAFVRRLHGRPVGLRAHLIAPALRRSLADPVLRAWLADVTDDDFLRPDELAGLATPVRVVWGRQERILPDRARGFWRDHLPSHAELLEPEGFGHTPFLDDRRWTASEVLRFCAEVA
ncbi:MAG: alpha/beta fold hydrolase [Myxococcota bacterium]